MQQTAAEILHSVFGYESFRGKQAEIIDRVTTGENILAIMPTGAGKSLCYQIPALVKSGFGIVVSPLISLMQNQVEALKILGVEAATINSSNSREENGAIWQKMQNGTLKLLYISPEKLLTTNMLNAIESLNVSLFAIDEAHCISQWGAAFRPEYEDLALLHKRFPHIPVIALTATADETTRDQIEQKIFSRKVHTFLTGFDRPNISLNVEIKNGWKQQMVRFIAGRTKPGEGLQENGIVYCLSRKRTEEACSILREKGYNALAYHAGMSNTQREENLSRFMAEDDLIMVATIAFGMGIDKPDIRFVFHTDLPSSPEAYYQEIGRAGRDGEPAVAHMLYGMDDIRMRRMFIDDEFASDDHKMRSHQRLNALLSYAEAPECRRVTLLRYFAETPEFEHCGNCDLCANPVPTNEATEAGQKFLSATYRTGQSFGTSHIVNVLLGKLTDKIEKLGHDTLPTYGIGKEYSQNEWKTIARQLMARGFIVADMEFGALKITDLGVKLIKGEESFQYRPDLVSKKKAAGASRSRAAAIELPEHAQHLYQALKEYRKEIATERSVPAYVIFSDKSLVDMALMKPTNLTDFGLVHGVGASKQEEFGPDFVKFIKANK